MFVYKYFMDVYFVYCVFDLPNLCAASQETCCDYVYSGLEINIS